MTSRHKYEGLIPEQTTPRDLISYSEQAQSFLNRPVYRERVAQRRKSLPHAKVHVVELSCGHTTNLIHPEPIRGELVFCSRCDDYANTTNGPENFRVAMGKKKPGRPGPGTIQKLYCEVCKQHWSRKWVAGRVPRCCPDCRTASGMCKGRP